MLRDTAEKDGHGWWFHPCEWCAGTREANLFTADYALEGCGLDGRILVERKRDTKEIAQNVFEPRFGDELARLSVETGQAWVVCEFPWTRVGSYPHGSGLPRYLEKRARVTGPLLVKRVTELMLDYPRVRWMFCDGRAAAEAFARSLFKRLVERARDEAKLRGDGSPVRVAGG